MSALPEPGLTEDLGPRVIPAAGFCAECFAGVSSVQTRLPEGCGQPRMGRSAGHRPGSGRVSGALHTSAPSGSGPGAVDRRPGMPSALQAADPASWSRWTALCLRPKAKAHAVRPSRDPGLQPGVASTHPRWRRMRRLTAPGGKASCGPPRPLRRTRATCWHNWAGRRGSAPTWARLEPEAESPACRPRPEPEAALGGSRPQGSTCWASSWAGPGTPPSSQPGGRIWAPERKVGGWAGRQVEGLEQRLDVPHVTALGDSH